MATTTMTSKGQLTVPKEVRDALGLKPGDKVVLTPTGDGYSARLCKKRPITEMFGLLPTNGVHATLEEIEEGIIEGAVRSGLGE